MTIVSGLLGTIAALVVIAVIVPWHVDISIQKAADAARATVSARVRWWVIDVRLPGATSSAARSPKARLVKRRRIGLGSIRAAWSTPGFRERIARFLFSIGRLAKPRSMTARWRISFEDPADTGMLLGAWLGVAEVLRLPRRQIAIDPAFDEPVMEGDVHLMWSVRPIAVLWPMVTLAGSPVMWRAGRAALHARHL